LAFYLPVIIWSAYITLTTWYTLTEPRRAPERLEILNPWAEPDVESRACRRRIRRFHFKALVVYGLT